MFRHGLVEGGVEYDNVRQTFEDALCGTQTQEVRRVVQGSERDTFFDASDNFVVNEDGFAVQFAAADDAVTDGADAAVEPWALSSSIRASTAPVWSGLADRSTLCFSPLNLKVM